MKTKPLAIILISLLGVSNFLFVIPAKAESNTIYVCPSDCKYSKIQDAVNAANSGDTIIVKNGIYFENINVNKDHLTIKSEKGSGSVIIHAADSRDNVIEINADYVSISGLIIEGATGTERSGISLIFVSHSNIFQNVLINNYKGIHIQGKPATNNVINNNIISKNNIGLYLYAGANNNTIKENYITNNNYGIVIEGGAMGASTPLPEKNFIYLNTFINNISNADYWGWIPSGNYNVNVWNSTSGIFYTYKGETYTNPLGNYWSDYQEVDKNGDGIGDTPYNLKNLDKDAYPLIEPFENYFLLQKWKFENEFLLNLDGNLNTVEGKGYALGNVYLSEIEPGLEALKIEGRISLEGNLPNQIPKIYLIATDGMDKEIASTTIPFNLISFSQIDEKIYSFSLSLLNPPKPISGGHYEVYLEIGNNPFLINTTSKISKYYFPLIYFPEKKVLIYEVYYDVARGTDPDNEWVIIHNLENETIDISNWKICDNVECDEIPTSSIPANGFAIVTASSTTFDLWKIPKGMTKIVLEDKRIGNGLANSGDRVILKDRYGNIVDAMSYGDETFIFFPTCTKKLKATEGKSLLRDPRYKDTNTCEDFIESEPTIGKNRPPIPIINYFPKNPVKGIKVKFDASLSDDPDGEIKEFFWEIKKGEKILATSTATITNFVFSENGDYQITLTATDNDGATSSTSTTIKVEPFSFAIITDLHIGRGYPDYDGPGFDDDGYNGEEYYLTQRLRNVVNWIIQNKDKIQCDNATCSIKFVTVLGDIADSGEKSEFLKAKEILDRLNDPNGDGDLSDGIPYVPVFGNHDVWPHTDEDEATTTLGENYFDEIFWNENATNTKLMKEILGFEKDELNKNYKNFAFSFGGINFIGLDFNSRTHVLSPTWRSGVEAVGKLWESTKNWLKDCLINQEKCLKGIKENKYIILSHIPIIEDDLKGFPSGKSKCAGLTSPILYEECVEKYDEFKKIKKIIEENADKILANFSGHIHGFYDWWHEDWRDANKEYDPINNTRIVTTEALMVGSNRENEYLRKHDKGIIKIVKILNEKEINYLLNEGKYDPETKNGKEFIALNPYITFAYKFLENSSNPCVFFKAHAFTKREISSYEWELGDGNKQIGKILPLYCYSRPGIYNVTSTVIDAETGIKEEITRKIEIKTGLLSKIIKVKEEIKEKVEIISQKLEENLLHFGNYLIKGKDKLLLKVKHSSAEPVGEIIINFDVVNGDIDFSQMIFDTNIHQKKSILYMSNWPKGVEEKILYIPK